MVTALSKRSRTTPARTRCRAASQSAMSAERKPLPNLRPSQQLLARVRDWIEREIAFVDHPLFHEASPAETLSALRPASLDEAPPPAKLEPGLAFVAGMVELPLLSLDEERHLFAWMNFLKHRAERNRQRLSLNRPDEALVERIESDLRDATAVRNRIVRSNLRLVVALAKKLSSAKRAGVLDQMSELISEGTLPLIRAVELFDVSLGNRFSTYATWAVRNQMFRCLKRHRSRIDCGCGDVDLRMNRLVDDRAVPEDDERRAARRGELVERLLSQLGERERIVIASRFGLDGHPQGQSLNDIARQIGLSKERVRQIVIASLEKLHEVANVGEIE